MSKGVIVVSDDGISVCQTEERGWCQTSLPRTVDGLKEAAMILAGWMELPCEDIGEECQRIHCREQRDAAFRDAILNVFGKDAFHRYFRDVAERDPREDSDG